MCADTGIFLSLRFSKHPINKEYLRMILLGIYYLVAITTLILHFTGHLERWDMEWFVLVLAATVFPAVLYL